MPLIQYPNVPRAPGVPALARVISGVAKIGNLALIGAGALRQLGLIGDPKVWQILKKDGKPMITPDSVLALEYRGEAKIATYPVEGGTFGSYNKVQTPADLHIVMTCAGKAMTRDIFLARMEWMRISTELMQIVTPDESYMSMCLTGYDYRRTSTNGVTLLTVNASFTEVMETASTTYTQTAKPSGAATVNNGSTKAEAPSPAVAPAMTGAR
jgi:hypothetical protein